MYRQTKSHLKTHICLGKVIKKEKRKQNTYFCVDSLCIVIVSPIFAKVISKILKGRVFQNLIVDSAESPDT